jgi:molybdopterin-guanine dinucleotide biosynthesis protein A
MTKSDPAPRTDIAGIVLAGGKAERLGGNKALRDLAGKPMIAYALRPLAPLAHIAINTNEPAAFAGFGASLVGDAHPGIGPLAGVEAGLIWAGKLSPAPEWLLTIPVDMPFLPDRLAERLLAEATGRDTVIAATKDDFSPVCALWAVRQLGHLTEAIERHRMRKVTDYLSTVSCSKALLPEGEPDPLLNVNTPEGLAAAERIARRRPSPGG